MKLVNCNICGSSDYKLVLRNRDRLHRVDDKIFDLVKCRKCGLVFINPQPDEVELKCYYPEEYGPYQKVRESFKYGFFLRLLSKVYKFFKRDKNGAAANAVPVLNETVKTYLDFGCGGGQSLVNIHAQHKNWDLYGFDNSEIACARARKLGFKIFCGDILTADLPSDFFDIINMSHVIEHLSDPLAAMLRINKLLKKNGKIIISTPNFDSLAARIFGKFWYALDTPRHLFIFSTLTMSALLEKSGFAVKNVKYKQDLQVAIKSWYFFLKREDMRMSPITWRLLKFLSRIFSLFYSRASIMIIQAEKK